MRRLLREGGGFEAEEPEDEEQFIVEEACAAALSSTVVEPIPRGTLGARVGRSLWDWFPAVVVFVAGIALWEGLVRGLDIQNFLLPPPSDITRTLWTERDTLWGAGWFTFEEAFGGWVMGCSAGIVVALILARWRLLATALMPFAIAANAIPIIAFAPITNNWFGTLNQLSKMVIAAVLCFFPVLINTLRGLTSVRPQQIELMRSLPAASGRSSDGCASRTHCRSSSPG